MSGETWGSEQIKEHVEALLTEKDRALKMADDEREKAASALRGEQQRAMDQAERERTKSAEQLRIELSRAQTEGDERLREHISNQVQQINAALVSADKLERERIAALAARSEALENLTEVLREEQVRAQVKFETSVELRFSQVNEFRSALDDLGKQMATRREMETAVSSLSDQVEQARAERVHQIDDLRATLTELRSRLDVGAPQLPEIQAYIAASSGRQQGTQYSIGVLFAALGALAAVITVVVILANVLTGP